MVFVWRQWLRAQPWTPVARDRQTPKRRMLLMFKRSMAAQAALVVIGLGCMASGAVAAEEMFAHELERGDTLIGLRDRLLRPDADWRELQRLNRIANPRRLVPGRVLQIPMSMLREQPLDVEVLHTHGTVTLRQRAGTAAQPLVGGARLVVGDQVVTGPQSSAALRFADGSRVLMRPDSVLRIERSVRQGNNAVTTQLRLEQGSVDSRVDKTQKPRFEIRTPVANLGVRGTEFRTRAGDALTTIEVLEGAVASPPATGLAINGGFGAQATARGVSPPVPLPASPDLRGLPARLERLPLQLRWQAAPGQRFRAQVVAADQPDQLLLDGLFDGGQAQWGDDLPDGQYQLLVRAVDASGIEGRDATAAFRLKARPEPPFSTGPRAGARLQQGEVGFSWARSGQAARDRFQLASDAEFTAPLVDRADIEGTELRASLPVGPHFWRLASLRADGDQGPWGDATAVTGVAVPPAIESLPPQTTGDGVLLAWRGQPDVRYQLQVAAEPTFTQILHDETLDQPQWLLRAPAPGLYHLRVRAINADGLVGPHGAAQQVEVPRPSRWWLLLLPLVVLL
ncbi:MAG: hypothetical protein CFE45_07370 [Burkholderiales bacterium PBB5]|nr:MAG: hypothetical protein CFE45_07370 [Burkholderiales bacterium PBB5]